MNLYEGKMIWQFDAKFETARWCVVEKEIREPLLRKEIFRAAKFVRENNVAKIFGKPVAETKTALDAQLAGYLSAVNSSWPVTLPGWARVMWAAQQMNGIFIASMVPAQTCLGNTINFYGRFPTNAKIAAT